MTSYKVFQRVELEDGNDAWKAIAVLEAGSSSQAIRRVAEKLELTEGEFFAVPERSYSPLKLKQIQKLTLT